MKQILLIFTGGTIGSLSNNGTIDTDSQAAYTLIELFRRHAEEAPQVNFKILQPMQILSENLHPNAWRDIISTIESQDLSQYDGIIVTHGTDTLAFSAALLGVYFHALPIPLLLVSSDLPLSNPDANGLHNFICAVDFIRQHIANGAFVPYRNPGQTMQVHLATRLSSCLPLSSDFISIQSRPAMSYDNGHFYRQTEARPASALQFTIKAEFARILLIRPYPGLNYSSLNLDGVDAVLHDLYHSGTACVSRQWGERHCLIEFSRRCQQTGVPLYLAPAIRDEDAYSSTREMLAHGAQMLWNISLETAYAKLALAYGNFAEDGQISDFLNTNLVGEQL